MSSQLEEWRGEFGEAYTRRNRPDWRARVAGFQSMLAGCEIRSVLEVGCNRGHNLLAVRQATAARVAGVEPQPYARRLAQRCGLDVRDGNATDIPHLDGRFDLVFTSGVLIHVPPDELHAAMVELARVSRRYLLSVEYVADRDEEVVYRDRPGMLWRRDYRAHWLEAVPGLVVARSGWLGVEFDHAGFTLLSKLKST